MTLPPHLPIKYGFDLSNPPPIPESAKNEGHFFPSFDGRLWMFYRLWEPPSSTTTEAIKATLLIVHGTVDHSGVYRELAQYATQAGIAVVAMDMRGWGLSDGESMYINDMDTFVEDVVALHGRIHAMPQFKSVEKRFLLGKSLGGLVTALAVRDHPHLWTGLLGLSGAYQLDPKMTPSPMAISLLEIVARVAPKIPLKAPFDNHLIVSDEAALQAWREDELCCKDRLRLGYGLEILRASSELTNNIQLKAPMFMMIGDDDKVVTLSGHQLMIDGDQHPDKQLKLYPGGRHNLLQEPLLKKAVIKDIVDWILARV